MLGKLLKFDLKYGMKVFILLHVIIVFASVLGRADLSGSAQFFQSGRCTRITGCALQFSDIFPAYGRMLLHLADHRIPLLPESVHRGGISFLDSSGFRHTASVGKDYIRMHLVSAELFHRSGLCSFSCIRKQCH